MANVLLLLKMLRAVVAVVVVSFHLKNDNLMFSFVVYLQLNSTILKLI